MKKFKYTIPALCLLFASCNGSQNEATDTGKDSSDFICIMPAPNLLDEVSWMLGDWQNEENGVMTTETWTKTDETHFSGVSYAIELENGDTLFFETMKLHHETTGLVYSPTVKDQNGGTAVDFLLISSNDSMVQFENPAHDFPQKIVYRSITPDSMVATISGDYDGVFLSEDFPMKRKN